MNIDLNKIEYTIECLPEDIPVRGNAIDSGIDDFDTEVENDIIQQLEDGNEWAWCTVKVTAKFPGLDIEGVDYLGGCSYDSEEDFKKNGDGYFEDMKLTAQKDLLNQLEVICAICG